MNKTRYEVNWHYVNEIFSHCTVTPITVIREGVLPGCSSVSISAIDSKGIKFLGSPSNYHASKDAAWAAAKAELAETIKTNEEMLVKLQKQVTAQCEYLARLTNENQT